MKKIFVSLSIIAAVAAIVIGSTSAFFNDTETSSGNTFTAGTLDLLVDIDGKVYNPLDRPIFLASSTSDIKPGDKGEETISLHVQNDACGFVDVNLTSDEDNDCTEPESQAEPNCDPSGPGELNDKMIWKVWNDEGDTQGWQGPELDPKEGNNQFDGAYERILAQGPLTSGIAYAFGEMPAEKTLYYGVSWELPENVGNEVQSDSFAADLILRAEQKRNQYKDGCPVGQR